MSSNLLKWGNTNMQKEAVRMIDANVLMEKRLESIVTRPPKAVPDKDGFVSGLAAPEIDISEYETDVEDSQEDNGNIIKAVSDDPETILAKALADAEEMRDLARQEASRLLEEAHGQAEAEKNAVLEEARRQGYEDGTAQAARETATLKKQLQEKERQLEEDYQKRLDDLEPAFIDTITDIYEQIFHVELESYREILVYLISNTIRNVENSREFMVHVSKEDYPFVSMQKKQLAGVISNGTLDIVEDLTLGKNACYIETESGIFDCGLDTQLEELARRLKLLSHVK